MKTSEHEKAILAISSLADQIGQRGEEIGDQVLVNIASCLNVYMVSAICGDFNEFLDHTNNVRNKRLEEAKQELIDLLQEEITGKKVTEAQKILRVQITNDN